MKSVPVVLACAAAGAVAIAVPAGAADAEVFGTYSFTADDGESATWTLTPCADDAPGCVRVAETGNSRRAPWSGDAHWSVGSLILFVQQPDAILCDDGTAVPGTKTYSLDGATFAGHASINTSGACGAKPASLSTPFRLSRLGAAETRPAPPAAAPAPPPPAAPPTPQQVAPQPPDPLAAESTATGPVEQPAPAAPDPAPAG